MRFPRKAREGNRTERFSSKLRLLLCFTVVLFSLIVLMSILVDAGKGSVLISPQFLEFCFIPAWKDSGCIKQIYFSSLYLIMLLKERKKSNSGSDCLLVIVSSLPSITVAAEFLALKHLYYRAKKKSEGGINALYNQSSFCSELLTLWLEC